MKRIKKRYIILISVLLIPIIGFSLLRIFNGPLSKEEMNVAIEKELKKVVEENDEVTSAVLIVYSDKLNLNERFAVGTTGKNFTQPVTVNHPYHSASIGKTFTSTIIGMLYEKGIIKYDDPISKYLDDKILEGLFVYDGTDYKNQVTVKQLLNHTSGAADYLEDSVTNGESMIDIITKEQDRIWSPTDLVSFSRNNQKAVARPGEMFHYSDTGYILLGFIIEEATNMEFHEVLHKKIINPLGMKDTYLTFKSEPHNPQKYDMLEIYLGGVNFSNTNALSIDWSGGGLVTTMSDLLIFNKALNEGKLVSFDTLKQMTTFEQKYQKGVNYGLGMMEFNFSDFSLLLFNMPNIYGGVGSTSTFMMYDKTNDIHIIANYGAFNFMDKSVLSLINILMTVYRLEE